MKKQSFRALAGTFQMLPHPNNPFQSGTLVDPYFTITQTTNNIASSIATMQY
jgi:hypothetical protein